MSWLPLVVPGQVGDKRHGHAHIDPGPDGDGEHGEEERLPGAAAGQVEITFGHRLVGLSEKEDRKDARHR